MEEALGLIGLVVFILGVIAFAGAVTWLVVKVTPSKAEPKPSTGDTPAA